MIDNVIERLAASLADRYRIDWFAELLARVRR